MFKITIAFCICAVCLLISPFTFSQTSGWTDCATESGTCSFSGTKRVRYGEGNNWVERTLSNSTQCLNAVFGDPAPGTRKRCQYADAVTWSSCASENSRCSFSGTRAVRFGNDLTWNKGIFLNGVSCGQSSFGDPLPGVRKECETAAVIWRGCATEGNNCNFNGTRIIRYGANGNWVERSVTNGTACNNQALGRDPAPGVRKTCYFAQLRPEPKLLANAWSDPDTWGGRVPSVGNVRIPAGKNVVMDMNLTRLASLTIDGNVECAYKNLSLSAESIMVHGRMTCGEEGRPYNKTLTITLKGRKPGNIVNDGRGMGTKVLGVMNGGILNLHGEERDSWLMLNQTANAGSNQLVLEQTTNWRPGDRLVVTSTGENMNEAEEVRIASVNGRIITLTSPLRFRHFGELQYFSNNRRTWTADTRAEVGLLSRNIKIRGDGTSQAEKFGGHVMVMRNSEAYISGVAFENTGQQGLLGRYPFHWHLAGDVSGQFIRNSTIYNSFNRCVTVHGSHNALVDDNVCFKHVGHGYFLEDGVETGNVFNHNLGAGSVKPPAADAIIPSDIQTGVAARGPATFWISNGDNTYTNNAAAGSEGIGFWYDTHTEVTGPSRNLPGGNINPSKSPFGRFDNNRVHSSSMSFSNCQKGSGPLGYSPNTGSFFNNLTVFSGGDGAVWPCGDYPQAHFENLMVLDTGRMHTKAAFVAARPATVNNSLFVANSRLSGNAKQKRSAFGIYDFGVEITNSHLENYNDADESPVFSEVSGALTWMHQSIRSTTTRNTNHWLIIRSQNPQDDLNVSTNASVIRDLDGTIGFGPNMSLTPDIPLMIDSSCIDLRGLDQAKMCPGRFVQVRLNMGAQNLPVIELSRSDLNIKRRVRSGAAQRPFYKVHMPVNRSYRYEADFIRELTTGSLRNLTSMSIQLDSGVDGDAGLISLKNLKPNARVTSNGWTRVNSMSALHQQGNNAWYKQGSTIHFKMVARGNNRNFKARSSAQIAF